MEVCRPVGDCLDTEVWQEPLLPQASQPLQGRLLLPRVLREDVAAQLACRLRLPDAEDAVAQSAYRLRLQDVEDAAAQLAYRLRLPGVADAAA
jgi:hypothetical protein